MEALVSSLLCHRYHQEIDKLLNAVESCLKRAPHTRGYWRAYADHSASWAQRNNGSRFWILSILCAIFTLFHLYQMFYVTAIFQTIVGVLSCVSAHAADLVAAETQRMADRLREIVDSAGDKD